MTKPRPVRVKETRNTAAITSSTSPTPMESPEVARARPNQQPEHQRRCDHAQYAAFLPPEAHQLALPQRYNRQPKVIQWTLQFHGRTHLRGSAYAIPPN